MTPIQSPVLIRRISLDFNNPGSPIGIEPIINKKKPTEASPRPDESPLIKIKKSLFEKIQQEGQTAHDIFVATSIQSKQSKQRIVSQLLGMQEEVREKTNEISKLQQTLELKENHIHSLERLTEIKNLEHQSAIDKKTKEIFELQRTLQEKENRISALERKVQVTPIDVLDTKIISPHPAKVLTVGQYIEEKRVALNTMQKQLNEVRKENSALKRLVQENHQMFSSLSQQLQEKQQIIFQLNQQLQYQLNLNATSQPAPLGQRHVRFQEQQTTRNP